MSLLQHLINRQGLLMNTAQGDIQACIVDNVIPRDCEATDWTLHGESLRVRGKRKLVVDWAPIRKRGMIGEIRPFRNSRHDQASLVGSRNGKRNDFQTRTTS